MRKLCVLLVLVLLVGCMPAALAEESPEGPVASLMKVLSIANHVQPEDFEGEPSSAMATVAVAAYLNDQETDVKDEYTLDELQAICDGLFESATLNAELLDTQFIIDGDRYLFSPGAGEPASMVALNQQTEQDGIIQLDYTSYRVSDAAGEWFQFNAEVTLVEDRNALFGYTIRRSQRTSMDTIRPDSAEATDTLPAQSGNTYDAKNAIDGKLNTCWAYPVEEQDNVSITLHFDEPTELRGICLTPGYAKSESTYDNNRKLFRATVTLDDGTAYGCEASDPDGYRPDGYLVVPFEGVHAVRSITIDITDTHMGEKFNDMCISEIYAF